MFRLMTYNIRHGGRGREEAIAAVINASAPDLVLLSFFVGYDLTDETGVRGSLLLRWSRAWRLATGLARHPRALSASAKPPHGPGGHPVRGRPYDPEEPLNDAETYARLSGETALLFRRDAWEETERRIAEMEIQRMVGMVSRNLSSSPLLAPPPPPVAPAGR